MQKEIKEVSLKSCYVCAINQINIEVQSKISFSVSQNIWK